MKKANNKIEKSKKKPDKPKIKKEKSPQKSDGSKNKKKVKVFTKKKHSKQEPETVLIKKLQERYTSIDTATIKTFADLPLSQLTLKGLKESGYTKPTEIQRDSLSLSLQGKDILGAAKTGSGKTLAFVIPILEILYCKQWSRLDGVGALVITPTRELAYQIFETLRKVGQHHEFSAGLIIGGKDLKFERNRMDQCNIVICTPGRLLQHMDENPLFDCVNMQILVLDEADRCLDMGFKKTMNDIIANLPLERQTLLFSATQTKSVKDLARLSLKDPSYVSVHEHAEHSTPSSLEQSYVVCKLDEKVSIIWSFIKNHLKHKIIIFLSTCKQVKYFYEMFCKLRPGTSLMALYGTLHQLRRMKIYDEFCRKQSAVLFATDLVSRGLDFPEVHWVVQADCPEDADAYIHRVGRTARYFRDGQSILLLLPSEIAMIDQLQAKKIPINKIEISPNMMRNPVAKMKCFLFNEDMKETAKRSFVHYIKSYFLMKNKEVFDVEQLDRDEYALSLGLTVVPRVRFLERRLKSQEGSNPKAVKNPNKKYFNDDGDEKNQDEEGNEQEDSDSDSGIDKDQKPDTKTTSFVGLKVKDAKGADLFANEKLPPIKMPEVTNPLTNKVAIAKKLLKEKKVLNTKIVFENDEEDKPLGLTLDLNKFSEELINEIKEDKHRGHLKVKSKHKEEKRKLKQAKKKSYEQEEQDEFGTDSEGEEPDLSWLPDPDKIYGQKKGGQSDEEFNPEETKDLYQEDEFNKEHDVNEDDSIKVDVKKKDKKMKKRKLKEPEEDSKPKKRKQKLQEISATLDVNEAEELALMLLRK